MDFELEKDDERWISDFREVCKTYGKRPPSFWASQRAHIRARIGVRHRAGSLRTALASVAALLFLAGALLFTEAPSAPSPVAQTPLNQSVSAQDLLAAVDQTIADQTPDALAPMELLSQDLDQSFRAQNTKETR